MIDIDTYPDEGCSLHPCCLACPRPLCIEDEQGRRRLGKARVERNEAVRQMHQKGVAQQEIQRQFQISERSLYRILRS